MACENQLLPFSLRDIKTTVVRFPANSTRLDATAKEKLMRIQRYYALSPNIKAIRVWGHSDNRGRKNIKSYFSEKRAIVVRNFLRQQLGMSKRKIFAKGLADKKPIASNKTKQGQAKNRRVVVELIMQ